MPSAIPIFAMAGMPWFEKGGQITTQAEARTRASTNATAKVDDSWKVMPHVPLRTVGIES